MIKIEITLKDEQGKQLSQLESLDLELGARTIDEIERGVEKFKQTMLPEISKELMLQAQKDFTQEKKTIILDWYHLGKKVREFLSMIARNKSENTDHSKFLFFHLWRGNIEEVLTYLTTKIKARNPEKLNELITYFTKHQSEIINYARRSQAGKTIGSGRMEKGVYERYWSSSKA